MNNSNIECLEIPINGKTYPKPVVSRSKMVAFKNGRIFFAN
jgi:hypothetical protein